MIQSQNKFYEIRSFGACQTQKICSVKISFLKVTKFCHPVNSFTVIFKRFYPEQLMVL